MVNIENFEEFFTTNTPSYDPVNLIIALLLTALLSFLVSKIYVKYGTSLSNRRKFANNFLLIGVTTTLIISIVKSSLALSLGLVGALSIVRFRAAIKEPEELGYLFLMISIGLGFGANQFLITIVAFVIIAVLLIVKSHIGRKRMADQNLNLNISCEKAVSLKRIVQVLTKHCDQVHLRRYSVKGEALESSFFVSLRSFSALDSMKDELFRLSNSLNLTYLDRD